MTMNFIHKHATTPIKSTMKKIVTFPSLFTTTTFGSFDSNFSDTGNDNNDLKSSADTEDMNDPNVALKTYKRRVSHYVRKAYLSEHSNIVNCVDGTLSTSLVEDIMSLVYAMGDVLCTYLIELNGKAKTTSEALSIDEKKSMCIQGVTHILHELKQIHQQRNSAMSYLLSLHDICAAMNDHMRLSESLDRFITEDVPIMIEKLQKGQQKESRCDDCHSDIVKQPDIYDDPYCALAECGEELVTMYSNHAILLSDQVSILLFSHHIQNDTTIRKDFFSPAWENEWTNNEVCNTMINNHIHPYLLRCRQYLVGSDNHCSTTTTANDSNRQNTKTYLFHKVVISVVRATICFYVRCLIQNRAESIVYGNNKMIINRRCMESSHFHSPKRALRRIFDDMRIIKKYFTRFVVNECDPVSSSTLQRIVEDELSQLELIYECLLCFLNTQSSLDSLEPKSATAASPSPQVSSSYIDSFILVIHKRCTKGNEILTRYLIGDLFLLMASPSPESKGIQKLGKFLNINHGRNQNSSIQDALQSVQSDLQLVTRHMKEVQLLDDHPQQHPPRTNTTGITNAPEYYIKLEWTLQNLYEDRMIQGILPVLCSTFCFPHFENYDDDDDDAEGNAITNFFIHPIRSIRRTIQKDR